MKSILENSNLVFITVVVHAVGWGLLCIGIGESDLHKTLIGILIASPILLGIVGASLMGSVYFWTRGGYNFFEEDYAEIVYAWLYLAAVLISVVVVLISVCSMLYTVGVLWQVSIILCVLLGVIFGPRFIIDLVKLLRFNNKTGTSERIDSLEKELQQLKGDK